MRWPLYLRQRAKGLQRQVAQFAAGSPADVAPTQDGGDAERPSLATWAHMTLCPRCAHELGAIPQIHAIRPINPDSNSYSCETCGKFNENRAKA